MIQKAAIQRDDNGLIKDVSDGKLYAQQFRRDGYFHGSTGEDVGQLHISLQLNTDGVALFRSSAFSIWPVYFIINELPPHLRSVNIDFEFFTLMYDFLFALNHLSSYQLRFSNN